jgi:phosphate transport system permease protein
VYEAFAVIIWSLLVIVAVSVISYLMSRNRAVTLRNASGVGAMHSLPGFHGLHSAILVFLVGAFASTVLAAFLPIASLFIPFATACACALVGWLALNKVGLDFRARNNFEKITLGILIASSIVAILTTVGIFASVAVESFRFFSEVNFTDFLTGTRWSPTGEPARFGFIPLLVGSLLITIIAIAVAAPLGLFSAIYLAEYSSLRMRRILKPLLELLAGIPTVVLGFFAALTVAPLIRNSGESFGLAVASESALAAGLVMGMMIVPLISSLSDDIINAVPQSLRDGSYAMGATKSETIKKVVLPAALPGIVSAIMLAISRAVGETMIVVMAAGLAANLSINPLAAVTTITVQIASLLVGDQEFDSAKTLSAFALGLVLFFITLGLNYLALRVVQKYKEQYD